MALTVRPTSARLSMATASIWRSKALPSVDGCDANTIAGASRRRARGNSRCNRRVGRQSDVRWPGSIPCIFGWRNTAARYTSTFGCRWRLVEISTDGWRVLTDSPVRFRRYRAGLPLPEPVEGGTVEELPVQLAVSANDWPLVAGWILAALRPSGPFPVLNLTAEQGAGKTTVRERYGRSPTPTRPPCDATTRTCAT